MVEHTVLGNTVLHDKIEFHDQIAMTFPVIARPDYTTIAVLGAATAIGASLGFVAIKDRKDYHYPIVGGFDWRHISYFVTNYWCYLFVPDCYRCRLILLVLVILQVF